MEERKERLDFVISGSPSITELMEEGEKVAAALKQRLLKLGEERKTIEKELIALQEEDKYVWQIYLLPFKSSFQRVRHHRTRLPPLPSLSPLLSRQLSGGRGSCSLVDADGFPRADIDVYAVSHLRHKIKCTKPA